MVGKAAPAEDVICRIYPYRGNNGSIHLDVAVNHALAGTSCDLSRQTRAYQYDWEHRSNLPCIPYLYPMLADGNPAASVPAWK